MSIKAQTHRTGPSRSASAEQSLLLPRLLALVSAAAATCHEVVWARMLSHFVGNTAWAVAATLAVMLLGMGVGSTVGASIVRTGAFGRSPYAVAELSIGVLAGISHIALMQTSLPSVAVGGTADLTIDLALACVAVGLPAFLMGATYPLLLAEARVETAPALLSWLYIAGLAGGVVGVLTTALVLVPRFSFEGAAIVGVTLNVVVAAVAWRSLPSSYELAADTPPAAPPSEATLWFAACGSLGLGLQVLWNRALVPYAGVSLFTFSAIVAIYLAAQFIGASWARRRAVSRRRGAWAVVVGACCGMPLLLAAPALEDVVPNRGEATDLSFALACLTVVAAATALPAFFVGVGQGIALLQTERGDAAAAGRRAGLVVGIGTAVSAGVALLVGLALIPAFGVWTTGAMLGLLPAAVLFRNRLLAPGAACGALLLAIVLYEPAGGLFLGPGFRDADVLWLDHGVQSTTAVIAVDSPVEGRVRRLVSDGVSYSGDSIFAQRYMRLLGHLPALSSRERETAAVICIGTGSTLAALATHPFREIDAVDISGEVIATLDYFEDVNNDVEHDPRVRIIVADGYRHLRAVRRSYDVITVEPPPPRAPGGSVLYTREFYDAARSRLAPGGVFAQWLPLHGLTGWELDRLVATFIAVFPRASLHLAERNEAILLGSIDGTLVEQPERLEEDRLARELTALGFSGRPPLLDTHWLDGRGLSMLVSGSPLVTYTWPAPELVPFSSPGDAQPLDRWLEDAQALSSAPSGSFSSDIGPVTDDFVRVLEGRAGRDDRSRVADALLRYWERSPDDPYAQFVFGFGPLLEDRAVRLSGSGIDVRRMRHRIEERRTWALEQLSSERPE